MLVKQIPLTLTLSCQIEQHNGLGVGRKNSVLNLSMAADSLPVRRPAKRRERWIPNCQV